MYIFDAINLAYYLAWSSVTIVPLPPDNNTLR